VPPSQDSPDHPDYRFTLANERTLLAWLRTGLALAPDLGVHWGSAAVALGLVLMGLGTAVAGYRRWRANEHAIVAGRPLPASWLVPTIAAAVAAVIVVVAVLVGIEVLGR
jgi:putative membrane protein